MKGGMKPQGENEGFEKHRGRRYPNSTMHQRELMFKRIF